MSTFEIIYGCTPTGDQTAIQDDCIEKMKRTFSCPNEAATFMHTCTIVYNVDEATTAIINSVPAELIPDAAGALEDLHDFNEFSINQSIGDSVF